MAIYNRLDYKTALPQIEKQIRDLKEEPKIFVAEVGKTKYKEVEKAIAEGKMLFAITSNSYGSFNAYPYSFEGNDGFYFTRVHGTSSPSYRYTHVAPDDTWTSHTINLATT